MATKSGPTKPHTCACWFHPCAVWISGLNAKHSSDEFAEEQLIYWVGGFLVTAVAATQAQLTLLHKHQLLLVYTYIYAFVRVYSAPSDAVELTVT